ncbi:CvpA family protein [Tranquillimonas alkanivorans]|uniref:Membrane protein required for colicin V production n=1 Tax=Tranquillimonas alkanivorans TaxID=441119 RepID=A0A1I5NED5_9RHOB|nr:CvpA family protein [Tranquillimonas alkanivorans]SFP20225.1 membrane protein required for colicin V production [Tranquillimonas alkanivorans]
MEGFTVIDGVVAGVIVLSAILAYSRGLVREALSIAGWVAAAIVAFVFAPAARPLMGEIPVIGPRLSESCELSIIASFAVVFAIALVIVSIFTPLFSSAVRKSALGGIDQGLGFLFGVARGVLLVLIAFLIYDRVVTTEAIAMVDNSRSAVIFGRTQASIDEQLPEDAPGWIVQRYEQLVGNCIE